MTVASIVEPSWFVVTKPRKSPGVLIGSFACFFDDCLRDDCFDEVDSSDCFAESERRASGAASADFLRPRRRPEEDVSSFGASFSASLARAESFAASLDASSRFEPRREPGDLPPTGSFFASRTARRLTGPRTGTRATKTQPTPGTGLPPQSRPSENSHS